MADNPFDNPVASRPASATGEAQQAEETKAKCNIREWSDRKLIRSLRFANTLNGLLLMVVAIVAFLADLVSISVTGLILAAYVLMFGCMMFCVEMNIANIQARLRRYFGFLFTPTGRMVFILFAATMVMSLGEWLLYLAGGLTFVNAIFNGICICIHPAFKKGGVLASGDPYGSYTKAEDEVAAYLRNNPELMAKAGSAAVEAGRKNPELAQAAVSGAYGAAQSSNSGRSGGGSSGQDNPFA